MNDDFVLLQQQLDDGRWMNVATLPRPHADKTLRRLRKISASKWRTRERKVR